MHREQRLRRRDDFDAVYRRGRSWANTLLVLRALPNGREQSRFGFSISKRVGNAVVRNRVKRRLRAILRVLAIRNGWDLIFTARPSAAEAGYQPLADAVHSLCSRAQLVNLPAHHPARNDRDTADSV